MNKKEEFIRKYSKQSGITVEYFHENLVARPCDCSYSNCEGWQVITKAHLLFLESVKAKSGDNGAD
jgi:hypothetical protein